MIECVHLSTHKTQLEALEKALIALALEKAQRSFGKGFLIAAPIAFAEEKTVHMLLSWGKNYRT